MRTTLPDLPFEEARLAGTGPTASGAPAGGAADAAAAACPAAARAAWIDARGPGDPARQARQPAHPLAAFGARAEPAAALSAGEVHTEDRDTSRSPPPRLPTGCNARAADACAAASPRRPRGR